jgi:hypothetical protein
MNRPHLDKIDAMTPDEAQAGQIMLTAISPFVVGLFLKFDAADPNWTYATGTPIELDGQKFILTAAHVVPHRPSELVFVPAPSSGFRISASLATCQCAKSQRWDVARCVGDKALDLAAILFSTPPGLQFFPLSSDVAATPAVGSQVVICGYPIAKSKAVQIEGIVSDLALPDFQCATVVDPASLSGIQPHQFAIDYPSMPGIVRPGGYSGSMVWYDRANCRTLEELRAGVCVAPAGVVTDHVVPDQAILCVRIEMVIDFLKRQVFASN